MMSGNNKKSEKGFTFLELIVCFGILLMVVVPICFQFMQGINQRFTVNSMTQATANGDKLLQDIKAQITNDIRLRNEIMGSKKLAVNANDENGISKYLVGSNNEPAQLLTDFLQSRDSTSMNKSYNTDKFSYEVGIWNMDNLDVTSSGNRFVLNDTVLNKSARFYTDINYPFAPASYSSSEVPVSFEVTNLDAFNKNKLSDNILYKNIIKFPLSDIGNITNQIDDKDDVTISGPNDKIKVTCESILSTHISAQSGFVFKISDGSSLTTADKDKSGIIEIDVRNLQREVNPEGSSIPYNNIDEYRQLSFKFVNETDINHIVKLKKNTVSSESEYENNNLFNIVIEDRGTGKTSIAKTGDNEYQQDYLITIIIREKSPVQGEPGKIVKKMIDTYSYDINNN